MVAGAEGNSCGLQQLLHVLKMCGEQEPMQCIYYNYDIKGPVRYWQDGELQSPWPGINLIVFTWPGLANIQ